MLILMVYVADILLIQSDVHGITNIKNQVFIKDLEGPHYFHRMEVASCLEVLISFQKIAMNLLQQLGQFGCKPVKILIIRKSYSMNKG